MRASRIKSLITGNLQQIDLLEIEDESHQHAGRQGQESHFKILLVTDQFLGQTRVQRQRQINKLLKNEFESGLHALSMRLLTVEEHQKQNKKFETPNCHGSQQDQ